MAADAEMTAAVWPTLMAHTSKGAYEPAAATVIDPVSPSSGRPGVVGVRLTNRLDRLDEKWQRLMSDVEDEQKSR